MCLLSWRVLGAAHIEQGYPFLHVNRKLSQKEIEIHSWWEGLVRKYRGMKVWGNQLSYNLECRSLTGDSYLLHLMLFILHLHTSQLLAQGQSHAAYLGLFYFIFSIVQLTLKLALPGREDQLKKIMGFIATKGFGRTPVNSGRQKEPRIQKYVLTLSALQWPHLQHVYPHRHLSS